MHQLTVCSYLDRVGSKPFFTSLLIALPSVTYWAVKLRLLRFAELLWTLMNSIRIRAQSLTQKAFEPFGEIVRHGGRSGRHFIRTAVERTLPDEWARIWVNRIAPAQQETVRLMELERHPRSAQTFIPLDVSRWLVVVAPDAASGGPDLQQIKAFAVPPGVGVTYRINTWHHGTIVFDRPAQFVVFMWRTETDNDQVWPLLGNISVEVQASSDLWNASG